MPRVHFVKKARKDNSAVKAGEPYYWWKFRYGGKRRSKTRPRPSQLTQSAYYSSVRSLVERVEDYTFEDYDDFETFRDEMKDEIQELGSQAQESLDNMPDSLQYSPTGELLQERVDACDTADNDLDSISEFEWDKDEPEEGDFEDADAFQAAQEQYESDKATAFEEWVDNARSDMRDAISNAEV